MSFYIYTNWQAADNRFDRLHHQSCGHCNSGQGKFPGAVPGENGVWIGAFETRQQAKDFHIATIRSGKPLTECKVCNSIH